jgi:hypothetical protein
MGLVKKENPSLVDDYFTTSFVSCFNTIYSATNQIPPLRLSGILRDWSKLIQWRRNS